TQDQTGNGRVNLARAVADPSAEGIQPAGTAPVGSGGPFVGPYRAAASHLASISVAAQSGTTPTYGTAGSATYIVTVNRNGNGNLDVALTANVPPPPGATYSFSPSTVSFSSNTPIFKTSTLTMSTAKTPPAVITTLSVPAKATGDPDQAGNGTPTITPNAITGNFAADNKPYDGNNSATVLTRTLIGVLPADVGNVSLTG